MSSGGAGAAGGAAAKGDLALADYPTSGAEPGAVRGLHAQRGDGAAALLPHLRHPWHPGAHRIK